ncbi:MAG: hypothetical protein ACK52I_26305 [Pseudomonadota bacterium]|jgi:hypothetical protein
MFAEGTVRPTYSGPITATGETFRRQRNEARAMGSFAGNQRAFAPQLAGQGVRAGSKMANYRAGVAADQQAAQQFAKAQQASIAGAGDAADSRFQYQSNVADEMNRLRGLLLDRDRFETSFSTTLRGDNYEAELARRRLAAERMAANMRRDTGFFSTLLDIV